MSTAMPEAENIAPKRLEFLTRLVSEFSFIRGNFLVLVASWLIMDFAHEIPGTYYALYVQALGGSAATIGLIGFAHLMAQAIVQFPGGYLADKYGRRWLISSMTFGVALSFTFYALAQNWQMILIGSVINGFCLIYTPALSAMIMDSIPSERRGMGFSIINLIQAVSTTPAPLVAGLLYAMMGLVPSLRIGYAFVVVAYLAAAALRLRLMETVKDPGLIDRRELLGSIPRSVWESVRVWRLVPRSAFVLFLVNVAMMFSISMIQPILLLYIVNDLGVSEAQWALIATTLFVSMLFLAIPSGKLIDRVGKKKPLMLSFVVGMASIMLLLNGDIVRLYMAVPLFGLVMILLMSSVSALYADLIPKEQRGKVSGFTSFFNMIVTAFGMLLGGVLYDNVSHQLPFQLQLVLMVPPLVLTLLFVKEPERKEE